MSRAWATSARNCFWIRNRRLPMLELPSIKNDRSTLQPEAGKRPLLLRFSPAACTTHSPLPTPEPPPPRVHRKEVKKQSSKTEGIVVYLFHNRFSPRTKVLDTWAGTYFHDSFGMLLLAILGGFRSSGLPVKCKKGLS